MSHVEVMTFNAFNAGALFLSLLSTKKHIPGTSNKIGIKDSEMVLGSMISKANLKTS